MSTAIEFDHVSKQYRLGLVSTRTLSHDLNRWWTVHVRGKEDPYLKIGSVNDRTKAADSEYVWALRDIDFKVEEGDVVGIIGRNGAGKSTLLKLLSRVTGPTTGTIRARGRIGSLLEVGTGFHPEMTGRENIYMNGAILGMTRREITRKLDEIVDFSGCERYLDTPVKRYSSGMMVRLGFAVAAHLDPEILVVDEVLAVGDAEFQKKAIGKMHDVSRGEGRTVLFVSHNMASIRALCRKGVLLDRGMVQAIGEINEIVDSYTLALSSEVTVSKITDRIEWVDKSLEIKSISINNTEAGSSVIHSGQESLPVKIAGRASAPLDVDISLIFKNQDGLNLASYSLCEGQRALLRLRGDFEVSANIALPPTLFSGPLSVGVFIHQPNVAFYLKAPSCCLLQCEGFTNTFGNVLQIRRSGLLQLEDFR